MAEYSDLTDGQILNLAIDSCPELGALGGGQMIDYETGLHFTVPDEKTAVFLASARELIIELISRNGELRGQLTSLAKA